MMGASKGKPAISFPIIIFVIITRYMPYIITPKTQRIITKLDMWVKNKDIPTTKAAAEQTTSIPSHSFQLPLHKKAYRVKAMLMANVAAMAIGTTGSSMPSTAAEHAKLTI